ncbi:hypothetical protein TIFTF001_024399 [Ficus carica]|uniref:Disease resistance protein RPM1-like n=1 Tax=Ficus carica TaxID=3494 RepID=A0AA88DGU9_FICCA|nr:hypothetical protein TIFTF001_024399 [Ficus carica]
MAESAVGFLLEKLSSLLLKEANLLGGIRQDVAFVQAELQSMSGFLRHADAIEDEADGIKVWVKQVSEVAYDAEDILDEYLYRFADLHQPRRGLYGRLYKIANAIKTVKSRRRIASELRGIKSRVSEVSDRHQRYQRNSSVVSERGSSSSIAAQSASYQLQRDEARLLQESQLVGVENPKQELVGWLIKDQVPHNVQVVAVVGVGGLGKTTLVNQVYLDAEVNQCFKHRAWITASQSFDLRGLLVKIIELLLKGIGQQVPNETHSKDVLSLKEDIIAFLCDKQYLIVVDDLWSVESWDCLKNAFPNNNCGSRLMVTTRNVEVASTTTRDLFGGITFPLKSLSYEESWKLFSARTFQGKSCPSHLMEISEHILKRCMGLPLAIVTISGVLATKDTSKINDWEMVRHSLGVEFDNNDKLRNMKKILLLSFNDLSYQLKSCLLFMSMFPEDWSCNKYYVTRLWTAQGFVQEMEGRTPEEVGELYFNELCNRSLLQTVMEGSDENQNLFCIHDLLRDIILQKSKDQNFAMVATEGNPFVRESVRHLLVYKTLEDLQGDRNNFSRLRTLLLSSAKGSISSSSISAFFSKYGGLRLLKVLDYEGLPTETIPECITKLFNLRLGDTLIEELPAEITQLHRLRIINVFHSIDDGSLFEKTIGARVPKEIGKLTSLQHLSSIQASEGGLDLMRSLGNLKQLRVLGVRQLGAEHGPALCSSIEKLSHLRELVMETKEEVEILKVQGIASPPQFLQRLFMYGRLEMLPQWVPNLSCLEVLQLRWSKLQYVPLESLQALPNLQHLIFDKAYEGEELCVKTGGFKKLKNLVFFSLGRLRKVKVEQGAMPFLQYIWLEDCKSMEEVPSGVEFLSHLKEIVFINMGDQLLTRLSSSTQNSDLSRVKHVPNVFISSRDAAGLHEKRLILR